MIFFSLTEASLPDPTQHPGTDLKRSQTEPKRSRNGPKPSSLGWDGLGGFVGVGGGGGGCKGKRKSLP